MRKLAIFIGLVFISVTACATGLPHFSEAYFFGDSLTDMGNFVVPAPSPQFTPIPCVDVTAPVTNKTGGTNPGETWAQIWAKMQGAGLQAIPGSPSRSGNDWAVAGAESIINLPGKPTTTNSVAAQVREFIANGRPVNATALYVIWAGANDILDKIFGEQIPPAKVLSDGMMSMRAMIIDLYSHGARNILVIGMPDLSGTPLAANPTTNPALLHLRIGLLHANQQNAQNASFEWNKQLKVTLERLKPALSGIKIYYFNPFMLMDEILADPPAFGFPATVNGQPNNYQTFCARAVANSVAVGPNPAPDPDPDHYLFFNYIHPTSHLHTVLAHLIMSDATLL